MPKLLKAVLVTSALLCVFFGSAARADNYGLDKTVDATNNLLPKSIAGKSSPAEVVGTIVSVALSFIGIVFFLLVLYAGFTWMTAMGNSEKVTKAKDMLEAAAIGLILVLASYAIARFVFTSLGGTAGSQTGSNSGQNTGFTTCQLGNDGAACNENGGTWCVGGQCVPTCTQKFPNDIGNGPGECINTPSVCNRKQDSGYCPGTNSVCCHD